MNKKIGKALVVGAGISGIRSALDLAETGYGVTLIDRSPHLGGILSQLDYQFPTDRCGMCKMLPLVNRDASSQYCLRKGLFHENIEILLSTELVSLEGEPGHFQVKLKQKPTWIDPDLCNGCGLCTETCPVEVPDDFNAGLNNRKAIYLPVPHAIPNPYIIDFSACSRCGECEKICPTQAIGISQQERKKFKILVVDDELIVRDSLKEWLEEEGFSVDMAESGQKALDKLSANPYHLMLTDIKMPGMDGVEVLQKAKESFPDLTVVMMTAYATVETAVEAMKTGSLDYLIKPFDPDKLIPMVLNIYEDLEASQGRQLDVGSVILCGGTDYFDPASDKNTFGYGYFPNVVTSLEFERILSGGGPSGGRLINPKDKRPIQRVAWIQCVGSRDLQTGADFCSNICCMYAVKEASLAKKKTNSDLEVTIFYMDMRSFGKSFQKYIDEAKNKYGVRFQRGRVHSVTQDPAAGDLLVRYADQNGKIQNEKHDMMVLAVGQRPAAGTEALAEMIGIELNPWGFGQTEPFSPAHTNREGIFIGGAFSGLKDISESVTQASAAALSASRVIHSAGGGLAQESGGSFEHKAEMMDVSNEPLRTLIMICNCGEVIQSDSPQVEEIVSALNKNPQVKNIEFENRVCTSTGWEELIKKVEEIKPNRLLIGACHPYLFTRKLKELGLKIGLDPSLMEVVDLRLIQSSGSHSDEKNKTDHILAILQTGLAKLKQVNPKAVETVQITQRALVVGGGIAGMTAANAIADHGFQVDLIEKEENLGGNLLWLKHTLDGNTTRQFLDEMVQKTEKHPGIEIHNQSSVVNSLGRIGEFYTTIENHEGTIKTIEHGVTILSTGGSEASTDAYGYGSSEAIVTQKELELKLTDQTIDPAQLNSVVMIQCVGSREEPRNYCSRVCCNSALKHALSLKETKPELAVYILYRDMMSYGFNEAYFTQARKAGVFFIQYDPENKPEVESTNGFIKVKVNEPIIRKQVEIEADLLVLATGVNPNLPSDLADSLGVNRDEFGFFKEAESKWRPVDSLKDGIFACGLAHSPRSINETVATAEAAAQRALRVIVQKSLASGKVVAKVRHSICSLCELCVDTCPYEARFLDEETEQVQVNPLMCQGCGSCAAVCPNSASILEGFSRKQILESIDAQFV